MRRKRKVHLFSLRSADNLFQTPTAAVPRVATFRPFSILSLIQYPCLFRISPILTGEDWLFLDTELQCSYSNTESAEAEYVGDERHVRQSRYRERK